MRHFYQCRKCRGRRVLPKLITLYVKEVTCTCGGELIPDKYRTRCYKERLGVYNTCRCGALHHPHRAGSNIHCVHFIMTDEKWAELNGSE